MIATAELLVRSYLQYTAGFASQSCICEAEYDFRNSAIDSFWQRWVALPFKAFVAHSVCCRNSAQT